MNHEDDLAPSVGEAWPAAIEEAAHAPRRARLRFAIERTETLLSRCLCRRRRLCWRWGFGWRWRRLGGRCFRFAKDAIDQGCIVFAVMPLRLNHYEDGDYHKQNEKNSHSGTLPFTPA
jgi:hypothetical protein